MKELFFYANFRTFDLTLGITRKVFAQIDAFRKLGYNVTYTGYLKDGVGIFDNDNQLIRFKKYPVKNEKIQHVIRRGFLLKLCARYLKEEKKYYELCYIRYHFFDKTYLSLLKEAKNCSEVVTVEAHSTPKFPNKFSAMYLVGLRDSYWNKYANKYIDFVASMSNEERLWGIRTIKIANAIDKTTIRPHVYKSDEKAINFISVSYEWLVHGYDRLIQGIYNYYKNGGNREVFFHMVGTTLDTTRKLIQKLGLQDRCILYGPMCGEELDNVYDKANIGVGCLANHRIGSTYGSALKTKEYIAKGIPFIYGWNEKILEKFPYALKFELCEDPIDINLVIDFYDSLNKEQLCDTIRDYLGEEDTWLYQMGLVAKEVARITAH